MGEFDWRLLQLIWPKQIYVANHGFPINYRDDRLAADVMNRGHVNEWRECGELLRSGSSWTILTEPLHSNLMESATVEVWAVIQNRKFELLSLFIVVGAMPAIVASDENVTVTFPRFDKAGALHVSGPNHTGVQFRFLNVYAKHTPNLINFFAKLNFIVDWNVSQIVQDKGWIAVRKIHFHHSDNFNFLARW
jgi:hypothetical protein